jgi:hypothetical protein
MFHIDISSDHASVRGSLVMVMASMPFKATVLMLCVEPEPEPALFTKK